MIGAQLGMDKVLTLQPHLRCLPLENSYTWLSETALNHIVGAIHGETAVHYRALFSVHLLCCSLFAL